MEINMKAFRLLFTDMFFISIIFIFASFPQNAKAETNKSGQIDELGISTFIETPGMPRDLVNLDINNDGLQDLIVFSKYKGTYIFINDNGILNLQPIRIATEKATDIDVGHLNYTSQKFNDFLTVYEYKIHLYLNNGDATAFDKTISYDSPKWGTYVRTADFNNDGISDFVAVGTYDDSIYFYISSKKTSKYEVSKVSLSDDIAGIKFSSNFINVADVDNDKKVDVIVINNNGNSLWLLKNIDGSKFDYKLLRSISVDNVDDFNKKFYYADFLYFDEVNGTSYFMAVRDTEVPELSFISFDNKQNKADTVKTVKMQINRPVSFEKVRTEKDKVEYLMTNYSNPKTTEAMVSLFTLNLNDYSYQVKPIHKVKNCLVKNAKYNKDIKSIITLCNEQGPNVKDGIDVYKVKDDFMDQ
ncbi:MAG: VCBS repeat-containing protein [Nitrospirae bacterium]|nr:VCBS repeat-containing protein [Nitrospirota bacterium]